MPSQQELPNETSIQPMIPRWFAQLTHNTFNQLNHYMSAVLATEPAVKKKLGVFTGGRQSHCQHALLISAIFLRQSG